MAASIAVCRQQDTLRRQRTWLSVETSVGLEGDRTHEIKDHRRTWSERGEKLPAHYSGTNCIDRPNFEKFLMRLYQCAFYNYLLFQILRELRYRKGNYPKCQQWALAYMAASRWSGVQREGKEQSEFERGMC